MRIEILVVPDCPHAGVARQRVRRALALEGRQAELIEILVNAPDDAQRLRFLGSPSIRVNGTDVELGAGGRSDYGLMCRSYRSGSGNVECPPLAIVRNAIRQG